MNKILLNNPSMNMIVHSVENIRAGLHHGPWSRTMDNGIFPWSNFLKIQFPKPLAPSLGVNQMWTKRNDHAPKNKCDDFY
jgi:hypothetical protein